MLIVDQAGFIDDSTSITRFELLPDRIKTFYDKPILRDNITRIRHRHMKTGEFITITLTANRTHSWKKIKRLDGVVIWVINHKYHKQDYSNNRKPKRAS